MSDDYSSKFTQGSEKILTHLRAELAKLQTGRASGALVEHLEVESYGQKQPLKNIASVSIPDSQTISIQPWDKGLLGEIEKAIQNSDISLNPVNNGASVLLNIPPLTEERRKEIVKMVKKICEEAKVALRQVRQDVMQDIKNNEDLPEDHKKGEENKVQKSVDTANSAVDELFAKKEKEVMTV